MLLGPVHTVGHGESYILRVAKNRSLPAIIIVHWVSHTKQNIWKRKTDFVKQDLTIQRKIHYKSVSSAML